MQNDKDFVLDITDIMDIKLDLFYPYVSGSHFDFPDRIIVEQIALKSTKSIAFQEKDRNGEYSKTCLKRTFSKADTCLKRTKDFAPEYQITGRSLINIT